MHAAIHGPPDAPTVVCVHGLGCSHRYFGPFARTVVPRARVVAVDLPGFGRSQGIDRTLDLRGLSLALADWLRATARGGSVLVGNSNGCQVVVDLVEHAPELIGPVVLTAPTFDRRARGQVVQTLRLLRDVPRERPSLVLVQARDYLACGPRRFYRTFRYLLHDPIEEKVARLRAPTLVVRGEHDPVVPRGWAEELAARAPLGRYLEVPDAPHGLNYSAPEGLVRAIGPLLPAPSGGHAP